MDALFTSESPLKQANETCARLGIKPGERLISVRISTATLQFYRGGVLAKSYVVSTSKRPPSNVKNSLGTPRGLHEIAERVGAGQPPGMVFKSRVPPGRHFNEVADLDPDRAENNLITSRILWLRGLEPGVNRGGDVDTYERHVSIHGPSLEDRVGQPQSAGCVLMRNLDIVELYEDVRAGDLVWIA